MNGIDPGVCNALLVCFSFYVFGSCDGYLAYCFNSAYKRLAFYLHPPVYAPVLRILTYQPRSAFSLLPSVHVPELPSLLLQSQSASPVYTYLSRHPCFFNRNQQSAFSITPSALCFLLYAFCLQLSAFCFPLSAFRFTPPSASAHAYIPSAFSQRSP